MGRGAIPRAEWVESIPRRQLEKNARFVDTPSTLKRHIDLRVVRKASLKAENRWDWTDYLDQLGSQNHSLGMARTLGSVAITYIPSKHINGMLEKKHGQDYKDPRKKLNMFRKLSSSIGHLISENYQRVHTQQLINVEENHEEFVRKYREETEVDDIFNQIGMTRVDSKVGLLPEEQRMLEEHAYSSANLAVRGLAHKGKRRFALDLTDDITMEERSMFVKHLRDYEHLDTTILDADWVPHATVFVLHDNIPFDEAALKQPGYRPLELAFHPPQTESHGL